MSVIQKIRDKYARWAVIAIALALLGFILMDAFAGKTGMGSSGPGNTIGKVNGVSIDRQEFELKNQALEYQYASQGYQVGEELRQQIMQQNWENEVSDIILTAEYEKLGLTVTEKEVRDILYGANPPEDIRRSFTDANGNFNAVEAEKAVKQAMKNPAQKENVERRIEELKKQRLMTKYMSLLTNTVYFPKWFLEKRNADNALLAKASYFSVPYDLVSDSTVKVSDDEIRKYINDHKDQFEQKEETRTIQYVLFSAAPSAADSAAARTEAENAKAGFAAAADPAGFARMQGSNTPFFDAYVSGNAIQIAQKDSILALPKGGVFGPYLDAGSYTLARMIDSKNLPDSVKSRHILLGTVNPQTGQPLYPDSIAKVKADSIALAIKNGASFDSLHAKYSTEPGDQKGVMTISSTQLQSQFAKEYTQFVLFDGKPGDKKVVKTDFGWHYIEVMEHQNVSPHYKVAYLYKQVTPGAETDQNAVNMANQLVGESRDPQSFNAYYEKNLKGRGIVKSIAQNLTPMSFSVNGLQGNARRFIKSVFDADANDVVGPERVGENYVVAVVSEVNKPGLLSVSAARPSVEPLLKKEKKGEQIIKNIGQVSSLEQTAAKMNQQVLTLDSLRFEGDRMLGFEPKVLGAIFNPANKGKVVPQGIAGNQGVYVVRVDNIATTPVEAASIEDQRKMLEMQVKQGLMSQIQQGYNPIVEILKRSSNIKDKRSEFY
ncbi:MAG TPA: SurA N-terminal domain-containing protein [Flavisolibacter sp.]|nr:SurA N-terminal domain-containing protein [Flavisolibacter sp.]